MIEITELEDWSQPVQIRIRDGRVEIRNTHRMGGLSQANYIDDEAEPTFWIRHNAHYDGKGQSGC